MRVQQQQPPVLTLEGFSGTYDSMKSPFPGMDPYLQSFWSNVHTSMMTYIRDQLQQRMPEGLWTHIEESVTIDDFDEGLSGRREPDVHISDDRPWAPVWNDDVGGVAVAEPLVIIADEPVTARHISIVDTKSGNSVVTAIEVLSPANKRGADKRSDYLRKQRAYLYAGVNLIEIDLIRAGRLRRIGAAGEGPTRADQRLLGVGLSRQCHPSRMGTLSGLAAGSAAHISSAAEAPGFRHCTRSKGGARSVLRERRLSQSHRLLDPADSRRLRR